MCVQPTHASTHNLNVSFCTAIIHSHALREQALNYYVQMLTQGLEPNAFTFFFVWKLCSNSLEKRCTPKLFSRFFTMEKMHILIVSLMRHQYHLMEWRRGMTHVGM